jgi:hypothetical protein
MRAAKRGMAESARRSEWLQHAGASPGGKRREQAPVLHMGRGQGALVDVGYIEERFFDCVTGRPAGAGRKKKRPATSLRMTWRTLRLAVGGLSGPGGLG